MSVTIHVVARPTEDLGKLRTAILNLFPDAELTIEGLHITGRAEALETLKTLLKNQKLSI